MSELKAHRIDNIISAYKIGKAFCMKTEEEVYIKSEADKVIAELKAQKAQAEDDCAYWKTMSRKCADDNEVMAKQRADVFKRERHHKYKRCLAMAQWCKEATYYFEERLDKCSTYWRVSVRKVFYERWHKRWLALAEEPTWAKFLQLIHKEAK